jgi:hypothetical protein
MGSDFPHQGFKKLLVPFQEAIRRGRRNAFLHGRDKGFAGEGRQMGYQPRDIKSLGWLDYPSEAPIGVDRLAIKQQFGQFVSPVFFYDKVL